MMACALLTLWYCYFIDFRIDVWWRSKNQDAMLQGYKIDLQHMVGSKLPVGLLKFYYRFSFRRRVRYRLLSFLLRVTTSGEKKKFCKNVFCFGGRGSQVSFRLKVFLLRSLHAFCFLGLHILSCVVSAV